MKKTTKKLVLGMAISIMSLCLMACGNDSGEKDENTDTAETTTEIETTTESVVTATADDASQSDAIPIDIDENGKLTLMGVSIVIPEGFEYSEDDSAEGSATFVDYTNSAAIVIGVDDDSLYSDKDDVVDAFDEQIKVPYGDDITYTTVSYNGHEGTEWTLDNEENGYVGRSLVICDDSTIIYIEYISYTDSIDSYTEAVNTIEY